MAGMIMVYDVTKGEKFVGCLPYTCLGNLLKKLKDLGMEKYNFVGGIRRVNITRKARS